MPRSWFYGVRGLWWFDPELLLHPWAINCISQRLYLSGALRRYVPILVGHGSPFRWQRTAKHKYDFDGRCLNITPSSDSPAAGWLWVDLQWDCTQAFLDIVEPGPTAICRRGWWFITGQFALQKELYFPRLPFDDSWYCLRRNWLEKQEW